MVSDLGILIKFQFVIIEKIKKIFHYKRPSNLVIDGYKVTILGYPKTNSTNMRYFTSLSPYTFLGTGVEVQIGGGISMNILPAPRARLPSDRVEPTPPGPPSALNTVLPPVRATTSKNMSAQ